MTNPRPRAANGRNGKETDSATSECRRRRGRYNALRHGLTAEEVLLPEEDKEAYEALRRRLYSECKPVGILESLQVDRIASLWPRLKRVPRIEMEILDCLRQRAAQGRARQVLETMKAGPAEEAMEDYFATVSPLLATKPAANVPEGTPTGPVDPDLKRLLIHMILDRVANKGDYAKTAAVLEAGEILRLSAAPTLGEAFLAGDEGTEALDRLARYEAFIVNQLQKAMQGLEDLQAKRLAQAD